MLATLTLVLAAASGTPATSCVPATTFTGTICGPATRGKHPAILLLGGSEGGQVMKQFVVRFAQHGYVAASVAYFKAPGLPQSLENVPVEPIGKALGEISKRSDVNANRIAILGGSKGGELALLTASLYPQIRAVVAVVPSPFAWQGIPDGPGAAPASSWTFGGKPLPYVAYTDAMGLQFQSAFMQHTPLDLRVAYDDAMQKNASQIAPAMFHLENIHGPALLLGADDDQLWDSDAQSQLAIAYLHEHHHPYADEYRHYAGAGHIFLYQSSTHPQTQFPMGPFTMLLGGTAHGDLTAQAQAWPAIYAFLDKALRQ